MECDFLNILGLYHYSITGRKRISIFMKLSATHAFNCIVLVIKFSRTSCEDIPPALYIGVLGTVHLRKVSKLQPEAINRGE